MTIPYARAVAITKSDTANFENVCDAIYVGGAGVVAVVLANNPQGTPDVVNFTCIAGQILPVKAQRVNNTNTTATLMVALNY